MKETEFEPPSSHNYGFYNMRIENCNLLGF